MNEVDRIKDKLIVIKIGGNVIDDPNSLEAFIKEFAGIPGKKILVHGGGKVATAMGEQLGIKSNYIDGRRITDDSVIDLVTMVYGGLINKKIVARLQSEHCKAIGITGADADLIPAKKRAVKEIDYGWVGDINAEKFNAATWQLFLENGLTPVTAPLTHDGEGHILNTNADTIASSIAVNLSALYEVSLVFCFEKNGVLSNIDDEDSVISSLNRPEYLKLKNSKKLFAGILPKIDNAFDAVDKGVKEVLIGNSSQLSNLVNGAGGTKIYLQ